MYFLSARRGIIFRTSINGWALGKLTDCEDDYSHLVWPSRGEFFLLTEAHFKYFHLPGETSCPPFENVAETPALTSDIFHNNAKLMPFHFYPAGYFINT